MPGLCTSESGAWHSLRHPSSLLRMKTGSSFLENEPEKNTLPKLIGEMYSKRKYVSSIFLNKTYNKKHEGTRRPSKSNIVAVTAKEQSTEHCENHPEK